MNICVFIHPQRLIRWFSVIAGGLVLASVVGQVSTYFWGDGHLHGFVPLFNLDREMNIPTWYAAFLFLFCAFLLWAIGAELKTRLDPLALRWRGLAVIFLIFSIDEIAAMHEMMVDPLRKLFQAGGYLYFSWVILGLVVVAGIGILFLRPLLSLPRRLRLLSLAAAGLFLSGAVGFEMIAGHYVEAGGSANFHYAMLANAEESLELAGLILFIHVLLAFTGSFLIKEKKIPGAF